MTTRSFIVLVIVTAVLLPICRIDGAATNFVSIAELIKNDVAICETKKLFGSSSYTDACSHLNFPTKNTSLDDDNIKQFLCLGLYDRIARLCYLNTISQPLTKALPEDAAAFDRTVAKLVPKNPDDVVKICHTWKNHYPPQYEGTKQFILQLDKALANPLSCLKICTSLKVRFQPLCTVLMSMDEISNNIGVEIPKSGTDTQGGNPKEVNSGKGQDAEHRKGADEEKIEKANAKNIAHEALKTVNQPGPARPSVTEKTQPEIPGDRLQNSHETKDSRTKMEEHDAKVSGQPAAKEAVSQAIATQPQLARNKETQTTEDTGKEGLGFPETNIAAQSNEHESDSLKNTQINSAQAGDDQAQRVPSKANDDSVKGTHLGREQIDDNTDVISEHTQNEDELEGVPDPAETVNEIESPMIPVSNEDTNEAPVQTAENEKFVPRLRGIRDDDDSHFFGYFTVIGVICLAGYVGYHNKQKILAMVLEGRRSRGGRGRRRPSTANYRKLDCTLEEAVTSQCNSNVTHVIY